MENCSFYETVVLCVCLLKVVTTKSLEKCWNFRVIVLHPLQWQKWQKDAVFLFLNYLTIVIRNKGTADGKIWSNSSAHK